MKVCTDSCLFGAWIADKIERKIINAEKILDVGTGTGLLSLMIAQKSDAIIDAAEIDKKATKQANENFDGSSWKHQLNVFNADIRNWNAPNKYDLIICNPPFYENDLHSQDEGKNVSKHDANLRLADLVIVIRSLLNISGKFAILLPWHRTKAFEELIADASLYVSECVEIKQTPAHNYFRTILLLEMQKSTSINFKMTIKNADNQYSKEFNQLLKDYYLYL